VVGPRRGAVRAARDRGRGPAGHVGCSWRAGPCPISFWRARRSRGSAVLVCFIAVAVAATFTHRSTALSRSGSSSGCRCCSLRFVGRRLRGRRDTQRDRRPHRRDRLRRPLPTRRDRGAPVAEPSEHGLEFPRSDGQGWAFGRGSKVVLVRRLSEGGWHANHALTLVDRRGTRHRLVLRRWARPQWVIEDPDFTPTRELAALERLSGSQVPTPRAVAADPHGAGCDVPTLLLTRLRGHPPGLPSDMNTFLAQLAEALTAIHAVDGPALKRIPNYRGYHDLASASPPAWSPRTRLWELAIELPGRTLLVGGDASSSGPTTPRTGCGRARG
jgi:hypothetical protein